LAVEVHWTYVIVWHFRGMTFYHYHTIMTYLEGT